MQRWGIEQSVTFVVYLVDSCMEESNLRVALRQVPAHAEYHAHDTPQTHDETVCSSYAAFAVQTSRVIRSPDGVRALTPFGRRRTAFLGCVK